MTVLIDPERQFLLQELISLIDIFHERELLAAGRGHDRLLRILPVRKT
jgi:hypothetical protein